MMKFVDHSRMGRGRHGWLDSHFHFSFAEYQNPRNIRFGVLRVMNDDLVQPGTGFDSHPHKNMEIISYVVDGALTHLDSMGNERTLTRGQVQYMSAGTGVVHSEYNHGKELLRLFQIWIFPDKKELKPNYGDVRFALDDRKDRWLLLASSTHDAASSAPIRIHADINAWAALISPGQSLDFELDAGRQAYLALIEGGADLQGKAGSSVSLSMRDAAEISEESFTVTARPDSDMPAHVLVIEMMRDSGNGPL